MMTTRTAEKHLLPAASMGNTRTLTSIRYGVGSGGKKAYIQAGLHADEPPGFLVMHHLMQRLDHADADGAIAGEIVLVPVANPIGVAQWRDEILQGRFDFYNSINFNRQHLDISAQVADRIKDRLGDTAEENVTLIRQAVAEVLGSMAPADEAEYLKHLLLLLSYDADIVLDLHCDDQAVLHVYLGTPLWPDAADLPAQLGAQVTLLAEDSGVTPYDEACSRIWWQLAQRFPHQPIPPACLSATVELRGTADVSHELASGDAENIFLFLQRRGFIRGRAPDLPELCNDATPLRGVEHIKAPASGIVVFFKEPGQRVEAGEVIAEIVNPLASAKKARVIRITSSIAGILFARKADRYARPGRVLAKIAGKKPLKKKGENLLTL